ncbi:MULTISPECIES: hypothetical protein [Caballeronia]|jgi:hypothetical protein|uniref:hypothetical protein n=2 Tax=Burkholderiaceae TaxID=119060 RepID=UPI00025B979C|nr:MULTISPECIES: hypothetical protein [Caballeronia]EKS66992.1 hypothetical protein BURK_034139 [Burkholderia sp. SJ98]MCG7404228.1 hypothetical protein [Caballeronia zhejiangensis]MCI1045768.1 hypothetical protein [Caballeronia zhejiangensis]MDR5789731.1 hypothetical protein [Caballeronia sp. LP003]MDR5796977.1 hypothetical protein [Caballeronia sp. LZ008]
MNLKLCAAAILSLSAIVASTGTALAQDRTLAATAEQVVSQEQPVHIRAQIVGIDRANRALMVRGANGDSTVQVGKEVKGFEQLKVGDQIDVTYKAALLVSAEKVTGAAKGDRTRIDTTTYQPTVGADGVTGFDATRRIETIATVESVDVKKRKITLRGAWRTETLDLTPGMAAEKLKKGDTIHAVYVSATAVQVTSAQ